ncbi:F-box protein PP2-B13-like [Vicia villosa]|uniref:F-box protein PP2-B13-like n=1 Tax=Vicia villosa TaxID=3911 RepID=UPI00273A8969|nr:F-box protein PP2-B13-like [Vicia villosa]
MANRLGKVIGQVVRSSQTTFVLGKHMQDHVLLGYELIRDYSRNSGPPRFSVVAELRTMNWLEIQGRIRTNILTPNKLYGAYLVMKVSHRAYGLDSDPSEISIRKGKKVKRGKAYLCTKDENKSNLETLFYGNRRNRMVQGQEDGENVGVPCKREDGWMEIEISEFLSGEGDEEEIETSVAEVGHQLKGGLIPEGIEVRPKHA